MVKVADRITNLNKPPNFWSKEKIKHYHEQSEMIYTALADANFTLANRLRKKIDFYRNYF